MSAALFFASNALSTTIGEMYVGIMRSYFGSAEIMVNASADSPSPFVYENRADAFKGDMDYVVGTIQLSGIYKPQGEKDTNINISLNGYDLKDLQLMNPFVLETHLDETSFTGRKLIISKGAAEKLKLKIGDYINLEIKEVRYKFQIAAIAKPTGIFLTETENTVAVVPKDFLYSINEGRGMVSTLYIKTKNPEEKESAIEEISKVYKNYSVRQTIEEEDIKEISNIIVVPLNIMVMVVLAISVFIIYSAFKVITAERLPVVGTFRSIGATKRIMNYVLFGESMIYGIIGGITGIIIGIGVLNLMAMFVGMMFGGLKPSVKYTPTQMLLAFLLAVILSFVSSMLPIIRVSKISVKDIVLNNISKSDEKKNYKLIVGLVFIILGSILPRIVPSKYAVAIDGICMLLLITATTLMVPYMTLLFVKILEKLYVYIFGNEGIIAVKNLRGNKSVLNNISLLAIGISALLFISTISTSLAVEVPKVYKQWTFEMMVSGRELNSEFIGMLKNIKGVKDIYGVYNTYQVKVSDSNYNISEIDGISKNKFLEYYDIDFSQDINSMLDILSNDRNIIITNTLKDKLKLEKGDKITLEINNRKKEYAVIGFMNYQMNNGSIAFIADKYFKQDMNMKNYSRLYVKTDENPEDVQKVIEKKYFKRGIYANTIKNMTERNVESNGQLMVLLNAFAIMAMIIGTFGVVNNFMISFMERKRSIAMFRSVGMSKKQNIKILFIESLTGGAIGGITGILSSILIISTAPYFIYATINVHLPMYYSMKTFVTALIMGIFITIIASIGPASKSSKLNIIEAIKYE
jgi:putative ABC transport system permease protein